MHKIRERGAPPVERARHLIDARLRSWEGARAFLEVVRCGSFRSAAQSLRISANTLRREIDVFEHEIGITLLTCHVDGVRLTSEGELLIGTVKRMEAAALDIARVRNLGVSMQGEVRLSVTEGLGTFWIAPRLVEFRQAYPALLVDIRCAMHPADVLRLETDIGIQITPPTVKDLRAVKIGRLHAMPFASQAYLDAHGHPKSVSELHNHHIVLQIGDQITSTEEYARLFPNTPQVGVVAFRANVSSAHYWLIARGGGIGMLPTYAPAIGAGVVPVDVEGVRIAQDIWLVYHPDAAKITRVRRLIDWLIEAFSPKQYPWFGDKFIHPRDLPSVLGGTSVPALFEGFEGFH
ncbi:MAG: LysR family transcriptional regulator [Alphaproteobacteria bacterium]|nr:LysR family transcriptional regulator [Alphaproteobacteria bacterium]